MVPLSECSSYRGFQLSSDFYEKVLVKVQRLEFKQLELLDVRVIGGSSYRKCTVTPEEKKQMRPKFVHISRAHRFPETHKIFI